jgi:hypothetical protein
MFARQCLLAVALCGLAWNATGAEPLVEKYLLEGKLADGAAALERHLAQKPADDQARAGLGVIQFLQTFEHIGATLQKHGLRTERAFRGAPEPLRELLPQNPDPAVMTYEKWRELVQTAVDDLSHAEATLAEIKDENVKLPLYVALVKLDFFGTGKPVSARDLMQRGPGGAAPNDPSLEEVIVGFDRGDVHWLRGYCHFLCAFGEILLAIDSREQFECTAHLFFEKVDSPHTFLQSEARDLSQAFAFDRRIFSDLIAYIHLLRFEVKEPKRLEAALDHLDAMFVQAKEMWKHYLAETDDEHEWIPNPKQTGVLQIKVTQEMVDTWLATLDEAEAVVQGKRLIPFWRGEGEERGVNMRRAFLESKTIDPILWVQGTAATPFLEKGELTKFANPETIGRINETFGGANFVGFAFWFQ